MHNETTMGATSNNGSYINNASLIIELTEAEATLGFSNSLLHAFYILHSKIAVSTW